MSNAHVPFPLNFTLSSPNFQLAPLASNRTAGWAPSCTSPACASIATWFTGVPNSTLSFTFWGWDVAFDGSVQGDVKVQMTLDGQEMAFNPPDNGTLFTIQSLDNLVQHTISLRVLNASSDALLSINQARINGSTFSDLDLLSDQWRLDSGDRAFTYTGFAQQASAADSVSPTTFVSSKAGDTASFQFNGSALAIYGPCGPSNGLMRVSIDGDQTTVNTSKPIQANDCLIYQSKGIAALTPHQVVVTNDDGRQLAINRMEFIRVLQFAKSNNTNLKAGAIVGIVVGSIVFIAILIVTYSMRSRKTRQKINRAFTIFCS